MWATIYQTIKSMEPNTRGGIGYVDAKFFDQNLVDKNILTDRLGKMLRL